MNEEIYIKLLSFAGAIILLLLTTLGYFLKQNITVLKAVSEALQSFRVDYATTKERVSNMQFGCDKIHNVVDKRLDDHAHRLDIHEKEIGKLQVIKKK